MGAVTEYLCLKDETYRLREEVANVLKDRKRTTSEKREIVEHLQKKIRSKRLRIRVLGDKIVTYYIFPGMFLIFVYIVVKFSELIQTLI